VITVVLGLLLVAGCATSATVAMERMGQAEKAVVDARQSTAAVNAPAELKTAEDKLTAARNAFAAADYEAAGRLAEQSVTDADYARAKAEAGKARTMAYDMRQNIQTLQRELDRLSK
jgi:hypothetical protein